MARPAGEVGAGGEAPNRNDLSSLDGLGVKKGEPAANASVDE